MFNFKLIYLLIFLLIVPSFVFAKKNSSQDPSDLLNKKAPQLSGKDPITNKTKSIEKLNKSRPVFLKDKNGKHKVGPDGKWVFEIKRNVVIINFFATYCVPCIREIPTFNKVAEKYKDKHVEMAYVNIDPDMNNVKIKKFMKERNITVQMIMPKQQLAIKKYKVYGLPRVVIIDKKGIIRFIIEGLDENLEEVLSEKIDNLLSEKV